LYNFTTSFNYDHICIICSHSFDNIKYEHIWKEVRNVIIRTSFNFVTLNIIFSFLSLLFKAINSYEVWFTLFFSSCLRSTLTNSWHFVFILLMYINKTALSYFPCDICVSLQFKCLLTTTQGQLARLWDCHVPCSYSHRMFHLTMCNSLICLEFISRVTLNTKYISRFKSPGPALTRQVLEMTATVLLAYLSHDHPFWGKRRKLQLW
jgi:hypothetical protein